VWRVEGGELLATMEAPDVRCLAVSKDGQWIAAGTNRGDVFVWDAKTYKQVFAHKEVLFVIGSVVDLSPDSTRLVVASKNCTATIWDIETRTRRGTLDDAGYYGVIAAKYSPQGDRIATASPNSVRIYDSNDGRLLVDIKVKVTPWYNTGLVWFNGHLFVVSDNKIKRLDASTGSAASEWPVPDTNNTSCIALPQHGEFIAYSTNRIVTLWDTSTHTQLGLIQHPQDIYSIALSPDDQFIAIGGECDKTTTRRLSRITEPDIRIDEAALDSWKHNQLANTEALLTATITTLLDPGYHTLASRALVQARLRQWDAAIADAEESVKIQPSVLGYIAKSLALVGKGEKHEGLRVCDTAFEHLHSSHIAFLLLIKVCIHCTQTRFPLILLRLSSCLWPENTSMRYHA
jgi:WD40 repeat protein